MMQSEEMKFYLTNLSHVDFGRGPQNMSRSLLLRLVPGKRNKGFVWKHNPEFFFKLLSRSTEKDFVLNRLETGTTFCFSWRNSTFFWTVRFVVNGHHQLRAKNSLHAAGAGRRVTATPPPCIGPQVVANNTRTETVLQRISHADG